MWVDIFLFGEALDVILDLLPAWEVVTSLFFWLCREPWELVKMIWDLESKVSIVGPPNSTNVWFLFEDSWFEIQILKFVSGLKTCDTSSNYAHFLDGYC